jgi:hypothetical protein
LIRYLRLFMWMYNFFEPIFKKLDDSNHTSVFLRLAMNESISS